MQTIQQKLADRIYELLPEKKEANDKLLETLADIEHTRWSKWQSWLHSKLVEAETFDGHLVSKSYGVKRFLPEDLYQRWERQINTPYSELSKKEKESDRVEARVTMSAINDSNDSVIRLADVLRAIYKDEKSDEKWSYIAGVSSQNLYFAMHESNKIAEYKLSQDNILDQSDDFCEFVYNLIK